MSAVATFLMMTDNGPQKYIFDVPGQYVVGRGESCTLVIPPEQDSSVSRNHCQILVTETGVYIRDTGSSNGTYINQQQLADGSSYSDSPGIEVIDGELSSGDVLKVGNTIFQVDVKIEQSAEAIDATPVKNAPIPVAPAVANPESASAVLEPVSAAPATTSARVPATGPKPSSVSLFIHGNDQSAPVTVNGWTIMPRKKNKNKNLIVLNNVKIT